MATAMKEKADLAHMDNLNSAMVPATASPVVVDSSVTMIERWASDPSVDVDKLDRLMQMLERTQARVAEQQFNAAMSAAQKDMRPIAADLENTQTRSRYASYAKLDCALRPIYTSHDFGVSYDTGDSPLDQHVRILAYVTHGGGHARTYHIDMPADGKGAKGGDVMTKTHATGSAASYGMRYLLKMIFNVAVGEDDDDGNGAGEQREQTKAPPGFADWWTDFQASADNGTAALERMWSETAKNQKTRGFLDYARKECGAQLKALKAKAGRVAAS